MQVCIDYALDSINMQHGRMKIKPVKCRYIGYFLLLALILSSTSVEVELQLCLKHSKACPNIIGNWYGSDSPYKTKMSELCSVVVVKIVLNRIVIVNSIVSVSGCYWDIPTLSSTSLVF